MAPRKLKSGRVRYYLKINSSGDGYDDPTKAVVDIDKKMLSELKALAKITKQHRLYCVERFDGSITLMKDDNEFKGYSECMTVCVCDDCFYWTFLINHSSQRFETAPVYFEEVKKFIH